MIKSEYEVSGISWHTDIERKDNKEESNAFNHRAGYGRFFYNVYLVHNDRIIPIEISVFKDNQLSHDNVEFNFIKGSTDSEILIHISGPYNSSEIFNTNETNVITINLGP